MITLKTIKEIKNLLSNDLINSPVVIENAYEWLQDYFTFQYDGRTVFERSNVMMDKSILSSSFDMIKKKFR